jgi:hypothetical protein
MSVLIHAIYLLVITMIVLNLCKSNSKLHVDDSSNFNIKKKQCLH